MTKTTQKRPARKIIPNSSRSLLCSNLAALCAGLALGVLVTRILPTDDLGTANVIAYIFLPLSLILTLAGNHFREKDTASANSQRRAKRSKK